MFLKNLLRKKSSLVFRLTIGYAGFFALTFFLAFVIFHVAMTSTFLQSADKALLNEVESFSKILSLNGLEELKTAVRLESESEGADALFYRILSFTGEVIAASDMSKWSQTELKEGVLHQLLEKKKAVFDTLVFDAFPYKARVIYAILGPDVILQLGEAMVEEAALIKLVNYIFGFSTLIIILSAAVIGWFMANRSLEGVREVTRTAKQISRGRFEKRVTIKNRGDEIEELASTFNGMVETIHTLITEMKEMTDNIAHDLKSPVTGIRGNAEVLLNRETSGEDYKKMAGNTIEACDRLLGMINTMLYISETESGARTHVFEPVEMGALVREAVELFSPLAEDQNIQIETHIPGPFSIRGDRSMLQRMVANLLDNAIKFSDEGGRIEVTLKQTEKKLVIRVSDTGKGIPRHDLSRIFNRYYRCDKSRSLPGSGLGLSLVQAVAHAHAGEVIASNRDPAGAEFKIVLPMDWEGS
jgi:heavy metal sensor kinase